MQVRGFLLNLVFKCLQISSHIFGEKANVFVEQKALPFMNACNFLFPRFLSHKQASGPPLGFKSLVLACKLRDDSIVT